MSYNGSTRRDQTLLHQCPYRTHLIELDGLFQTTLNTYGPQGVTEGSIRVDFARLWRLWVNPTEAGQTDGPPAKWAAVPATALFARGQGGLGQVVEGTVENGSKPQDRSRTVEVGSFTRPVALGVQRNQKDKTHIPVPQVKQAPSGAMGSPSGGSGPGYAFRAPRPKEAVDNFGGYVQQGRIEIGALFGKEIDSLCGPEELIRLRYPSLGFQRQEGGQIRVGSIPEGPGRCGGLSSVLAGSGVQYFWAGLPTYFEWGRNDIHTFWEEAAILRHGRPLPFAGRGRMGRTCSSTTRGRTASSNAGSGRTASRRSTRVCRACSTRGRRRARRSMGCGPFTTAWTITRPIGASARSCASGTRSGRIRSGSSRPTPCSLPPGRDRVRMSARSGASGRTRTTLWEPSRRPRRPRSTAWPTTDGSRRKRRRGARRGPAATPIRPKKSPRRTTACSGTMKSLSWSTGCSARRMSHRGDTKRTGAPRARERPRPKGTGASRRRASRTASTTSPSTRARALSAASTTRSFPANGSTGRLPTSSIPSSPRGSRLPRQEGPGKAEIRVGQKGPVSASRIARRAGPGGPQIVPEPRRDPFPGSNSNYYAVPHGASVSKDEVGITLSPVESHRLEFGGLWPCYVAQAHHGVDPADGGRPFVTPEQLTKGYQYAFVLGRNFRTNFQPVPQADILFRYSLTSSAGPQAHSTHRDFGWSIHNPLTAVLVHGGRQGPRPGQASFCGWDQANVMRTTSQRAEDGQGLIVRLIETDGQSTTATLSVPAVTVEKAWRTNPVEENQCVLDGTEHSVTVPIKALGIATIRLQVAP